jgi:hypothetical protein
MADSTSTALGGDFVAVGEIDVRGRQDKIKIWSIEEARKPLGPASPTGYSGPALST